MISEVFPIISLIGRSNVGKSTLFNYLTKSQAALVADTPGVTRDRQYGEAIIGSHRILVVDTGGLVDLEESTMSALLKTQVNQAIKESDSILFLVDAKIGLIPADEIVTEQLRKKNKKVFLVVNKVDKTQIEKARNEFYRLGFDELHAISAKTGLGVKQLLTSIINKLRLTQETAIRAVSKQSSGIKITMIGRPNVGKSTLVNRMLGEERVIVYDQPGTTRNSIYIPFTRENKNYTLIDTAGVRKQTKILDQVEKFSIIKSIQSIYVANVVIFILNAHDSISEQDLRLLNLIIEIGAPLVIVVNKWDGLQNEKREQVKKDIGRRMSFTGFSRLCFISALKGVGIEKVFRAVEESYQSTQQELTTNQLTRTLRKAISEYEPPLVKGRRIRLRYAHLGDRHPLTVVIHGKQAQSLSKSYSRYLANYFRKKFNFVGVPICIKLKTDRNPYEREII